MTNLEKKIMIRDRQSKIKNKKKEGGNMGQTPRRIPRPRVDIPSMSTFTSKAVSSFGSFDAFGFFFFFFFLASLFPLFIYRITYAQTPTVSGVLTG